MREFIVALMTDKLSGPVFVPFKALLYLVSLPYGLAILCRRFLYAVRIFKSRRAPMRIVSVGNLTLGGTGKTPCVIALAGIIRSELRREPCVLIRGYGWDEQALLKKSLPDTPILVGEDRVKQSHRAVALYGSSIGILDDGFQYWELARDLNIVLVDSRHPFGNGHLFPRGVLREPKAALRRADIVIFTKMAASASPAGIEPLKRDMKRYNRRLEFCTAAHRPKHLYDARARKEYDLSAVSGKRVVLISSIGDPGYFEETARSLGVEVIEHIAFGDHHDYRSADIERIKRRCDGRPPDYIVTTEKDSVKLARRSFSFGKHVVLTLVIEMEITTGKEILIDRLHSLRSC